MRFWVDSWDPAYAAENGPVAAEPATVAGTDPEVEVPAAVWTPMPYPADLRPPRTVLLVDGVRRDDARLWTAEPDGSSLPALAASYAAGVVRCDLWEGRAALAGEPVVERGLFTPSRTLTDLECAGRVRRLGRNHGRKLKPASGVEGGLRCPGLSIFARAHDIQGVGHGCRLPSVRSTTGQVWWGSFA